MRQGFGTGLRLAWKSARSSARSRRCRAPLLMSSADAVWRWCQLVPYARQPPFQSGASRAIRSSFRWSGSVVGTCRMACRSSWGRDGSRALAARVQAAPHRIRERLRRLPSDTRSGVPLLGHALQLRACRLHTGRARNARSSCRVMRVYASAHRRVTTSLHAKSPERPSGTNLPTTG